MMNFPLSVFTPVLGAASETFIQRHALDLNPQGTSIIYTKAYSEMYWDTIGPKITIGDELSLSSRIYNKFHFTVTSQDRRSDLDPVRTNAIIKFLKSNNTKVVLGEYLDQSLWLLKIAKSLNIRFFAHAHGYDVSSNLRDPFWRKEYLKYNEADGVITMSNISKQKLIDIGIQDDIIHVIPYGVEVDGFKKTFHKGNSDIKCLAVGRMVEKKAPLKLLTAFHAALKTCPNMHLDYIGSGDLLPLVENYLSQNNLQKKITLHYEKPNSFVKKAMEVSDIFLQHSITDPYTGDQEGLPVAIIEAMAHSLPVISTLHGGIPEAVIHNKTGFLVAEGDVEGMANFIVKLNDDFTLRKALGKASYERFESNFVWKVERAKLKELLEI